MGNERSSGMGGKGRLTLAAREVNIEAADAVHGDFWVALSQQHSLHLQAQVLECLMAHIAHQLLLQEDIPHTYSLHTHKVRETGWPYLTRHWTISLGTGYYVCTAWEAGEKLAHWQHMQGSEGGVQVVQAVGEVVTGFGLHLLGCPVVGRTLHNLSTLGSQAHNDLLLCSYFSILHWARVHMQPSKCGCWYNTSHDVP